MRRRTRRLGIAKMPFWRGGVDFVDVTFRRKVTYLTIPTFNRDKALGRVDTMVLTENVNIRIVRG